MMAKATNGAVTTQFEMRILRLLVTRVIAVDINRFKRCFTMEYV